MQFSDLLDEAIARKGNPICIGLDPRLDQLPKAITEAAVARHGKGPEAAAEAILTFNKAILDAVADIVPICKPQVAFYEEYGWQGLRCFAETIQYARRKGVLVISDSKRGDIGTTAEAYSNAHLGPDAFAADALTVNPYMGRDTLEPYLKHITNLGRGIFVLVKTSNPGSGDLQDLTIAGGKPIREHVAEMVNALGQKHRGTRGLSDIGAVVGATYPAEARRLRELMPDAFILIPGYGAQGGTAQDAVAGFRSDGRGGIVNNSRGLLFAYKQKPYSETFGDKDFAGACRAATQKMAEELRAALAR